MTDDSVKCKLLMLTTIAMEKIQGSGKVYDPLHENHYHQKPNGGLYRIRTNDSYMVTGRIQASGRPLILVGTAGGLVIATVKHL
jgi:hypothetical protein